MDTSDDFFLSCLCQSNRFLRMMNLAPSVHIYTNNLQQHMCWHYCNADPALHFVDMYYREIGKRPKSG